MARILIADDDSDVRHLMTFALADRGHQVSVAPDGPTAISLALKDQPELLILDIMMPGMDGYQVLEALETGGVRERMKVLIVTAKGTERDWEQGLAAGADLYMTKPFDPEELGQTVEEILSATDEELAMRREKEKDRAHLLSQLEDLLGGA